MASQKLLDAEWAELSRAVTTLSLKDCLSLLKAEASDRARPYVLERLYSGVRKQLYIADMKLIEKGEIPAWVLKL